MIYDPQPGNPLSSYVSYNILPGKSKSWDGRNVTKVTIKVFHGPVTVSIARMLN